MIKTETDLYYIVKYNDIYKDNKIWEVCNDGKEAEKHMNHIVERFRNEVSEVWIEYIEKTVTKKIKLHKKVIIDK